MCIPRRFLRKSQSNLGRGVFGTPGCLFECLTRNFGVLENMWGAAKHPWVVHMQHALTNSVEGSVRKEEQVSENTGNTILQQFIASNASGTEKSEYLQRVRKELQRWEEEITWTTPYLRARLLELGSKFFLYCQVWWWCVDSPRFLVVVGAELCFVKWAG